MPETERSHTQRTTTKQQTIPAGDRMSAALANHHHTELHSHHPHLGHQANIMHPQEELNFSTFMDLCRFCSLRPGLKLNLYEKEADQRQVLYKLRSVLPAVVRAQAATAARSGSTTNDNLPVSDQQRRLAAQEDLQQMPLQTGGPDLVAGPSRRDGEGPSQLLGVDAGRHLDD